MKKKIKGFDVFLIILLSLLCIVTLYPVLYVLFSSVSDPVKLQYYDGLIYKPEGFSLKAYSLVLNNPSIGTGYKNTILYTVCGTLINMGLTILGAYAISRKDLYIRKSLTIFIVITMQFGGGLIPTFLVVSGLLKESIWTQLLPGAIAGSNLLIMRTAFMSIPDSLEESVRIDGGNDWTVLRSIVLPLSKPTLAVITLYYGVAHWNNWLPAVIYLRDRSKYPLQLFLREILIQNQLDETTLGVMTELVADMSEVIKYSTIIVAIVPVLCIYPFLQRYFVKGVMLGAVKG